MIFYLCLFQSVRCYLLDENGFVVFDSKLDHVSSYLIITVALNSLKMCVSR